MTLYLNLLINYIKLLIYLPNLLIKIDFVHLKVNLVWWMSLSCFDDYFLTNMLICPKLLCLSICICGLLENIINMSVHLFISFVIMHNMSNSYITDKLCFNSCFYDKLYILQVKKNIFIMIEWPFFHKNFTKIKLG